MKVLDLRLEADPGADNVRNLYLLGKNHRRDLSALIDAVTVRLDAAPEWLYSAPAERNPLVSSLLYRLSCLLLVAKLFHENRLPSTLVTDSPAMASALSLWIKRQGVDASVTLQPGLSLMGRLYRMVRTVVGSVLWLAWIRLAARLSGRAQPTPQNPIILLNVFVLRDAPEHDRYFPGLLEALSCEERSRVYQVPTIYGNGFRGFFGLVKALRKRKNCLLKEDWLTAVDYVSAMAWPIRSTTLQIGSLQFHGFAVDEMIREELHCLQNYSSMVIARLNERLAFRLAAAGIVVERTVSWFENQPVDRGWNRGFLQAYPAALRLGYEGFVPPELLLSYFPTVAEKRAGVLPDELAVMGPLIAEQVGRFCPGLAVRVAPAFRFRYLTEAVGDAARPVATRVVAPLPMSVAEARRVLSMLVGAVGSPALAGHEVLVKLHPATDRKALADLLDAGLPGNMRLVNDPMERLLPGSAALVSTASSVCIEALCMGVPVALLARPGALLLSPLPESLEGDMWRLCVTQEDLERSLEGFLAAGQTLRERFAPELERLRRGLFSPVTTKGARALLGFAPDENSAFNKEE